MRRQITGNNNGGGAGRKQRGARGELTSETTAARHFDVLILGPFALYADGRPVDTSSWQRKVQTLLRLLVTAPGMRRTRDELVCLLWPEAGAEAGFRNLRVVLHMLRRALDGEGAQAVLSENGWIGLNPVHEWDVDLARLEHLASTAGDHIELLEQAAGYYRGEPLVEDRYEEWAVAVRGRVQRIWRDVCLRLARLHLQSSRPDMALGWLERTLEADPLDEEAFRLLLTTLRDLDRRGEALRRFQQFARRLQDDLDIAPGAEIMALVAEMRGPASAQLDIQDAPLPPLESATRPLPVIPQYDLPVEDRMVGRAEELGRVLWALPPLHGMSTRLVIISGPAGVGKTRLLAEVAMRSRRAGLLTLAGAAYALSEGISYGPIRDALADYIDTQPEGVVRTQLGDMFSDLVRILPELRLRFPEVSARVAAEGEDVRLALFAAVTRALERIGQDQPLVLLLDDLQWSDLATLQMLHFTVRRLTQDRVLIVGTFRSDESSDGAVVLLARETEAMGWAIRLTLDRMGADDLAQIVGDRLRGRVSAELSEALDLAGDGTPLGALTLADRWRHESRLRQVNGEWRLANEVENRADFPVS